MSPGICAGWAVDTGELPKGVIINRVLPYAHAMGFGTRHLMEWFNCSRSTAINWMNGHTNAPVHVEERLNQLYASWQLLRAHSFEVTPKPKRGVPRTIGKVTDF